MTTSNDFINHVAAHAGISPERAAYATRVVLAGLGAHLSAPRRELVAEELPPALASALLADAGVATPIDERVLAPDVPAGQARELIASVCRALAEELSAEAVGALQRSAPPELAAFLAPPVREARPRAASHPPPRETLAAGRPGSRHPVSEARPPRPQPDAVTADNPHAATKLSSTSGSAQERRRDTLAQGRPGSAHPISRSHR
jgi:uncharacterized protein (DUF2267 family)